MGRLDTAHHLKGFCLDGMLLSLPSRFGTSGWIYFVFSYIFNIKNEYQ